MSKQNPGMWRRWVVAALGIIWASGLAFGGRALFRYVTTPGRLAEPPPDWPSGAAMALKNGRPILLVFAHPQCPCSAATIGELNQIMSRFGNKMDAYVLFYAPRSEADVWVKADLWREASAIRGVLPMEDRDGRQAARFGAATSGQTLLYDGSGRLVFNGGITAARGHFGDNEGVDAILSILGGGSSPIHQAPVFGCSLLGEA